MSPPLFHQLLSALLAPSLSPPQVSLTLALSCVFKVIAHGSQGVCIRACHKQSNGMSRGLVHEPNPVSEAKWIDGGVKKLFKRNMEERACFVILQKQH